MGYALAEAALEAGHEVILISGPVKLYPPRDAKFVLVSTSDEMFDAVHQHAANCDACILCAAVADHKPAKVSPVKIKKRTENFSLELVPTRDILESLGCQRHRQFLLVGFAAETNNIAQNATKKLRAKHCDIMVANDARLAMESDENELLILFRDGEIRKISRAQKTILARELVKIFSKFATKTFDKKNETITERN
jgi:phosphopantothenoylcysteine decarboxylase / phosphopantothenate---cysteine ligase